MALLVTGLTFLPVIAFIGVSAVGELALGGEGSATYWANATFHNTLASFGTWYVLLVIVITLGVGMAVLVLCLGKSGVAAS